MSVNISKRVCVGQIIIIVFPTAHTRLCLCAFNYSQILKLVIVFDLSRLVFEQALLIHT